MISATYLDDLIWLEVLIKSVGAYVHMSCYVT